MEMLNILVVLEMEVGIFNKKISTQNSTVCFLEKFKKISAWSKKSPKFGDFFD